METEKINDFTLQTTEVQNPIVTTYEREQLERELAQLISMRDSMIANQNKRITKIESLLLEMDKLNIIQKSPEGEVVPVAIDFSK